MLFRDWIGYLYKVIASIEESDKYLSILIPMN